MKTAFISGITGQDGSYLAELLLRKGYFVVGLKRRTSLICTERINKVYDNPNFAMEYWDLNDASATYRLLLKYKPDEFYNLAAQLEFLLMCQRIPFLALPMELSAF